MWVLERDNNVIASRYHTTYWLIFFVSARLQNSTKVSWMILGSIIFTFCHARFQKLIFLHFKKMLSLQYFHVKSCEVVFNGKKMAHINQFGNVSCQIEEIAGLLYFAKIQILLICEIRRRN